MSLICGHSSASLKTCNIETLVYLNNHNKSNNLYFSSFQAKSQENGYNDADLENIEPGKVLIQLEHNGNQLYVDDDDVEKANPSNLDLSKDLCHLKPVLDLPIG